MAEAPAARFLTVFEDSRRWRNIKRRTGDIVISTPPKSGTTWMQGIVAALLWPDGVMPGTRSQLSPWIDMRLMPIDQLSARVEEQNHRRFFKTHSPGDCIPFDPRCRYLLVYRDGRDALVSWANHRTHLRPEIVEAANAAARESGVEPMATVWDGDYDSLFDEWEAIGSPVRHLASWWQRRHADNVLFVHYEDLSADLEGETRRIASFLDLEQGIGDEQWGTIVDRCTIGEMRAVARADGDLDRVFDGGADVFFNRGVAGRWRQLLAPPHLDRYESLVADLSPEAAAWLEAGTGRSGVEPSQVGSPPETVATGGFHPVFSRLAARPLSSMEAITERRVGEARAAGLFDGLALQGKPIPDIDRHRPPGWWAQRFVARERNKVKALQLEDEIRRAMPGLWRLDTASAVTAEVARLNARIASYNRVTSLAPLDKLDADATLDTWRSLRSRRQ